MRRKSRYPDEVESNDCHWLAGLLEGEGSFMAGPPSSPTLPLLTVAMVDRDVVERAGDLLGPRATRIRARQRQWKDSYVVSIRGAAAVAWMRALRPYLGIRRQQQIDAAIRSYRPSAHRLTREQVWQALELLANGVPVRETAEAIGVSSWCIYDLRLGRSHVRWADQWRQRRDDRVSAAAP